MAVCVECTGGTPVAATDVVVAPPVSVPVRVSIPALPKFVPLTPSSLTPPALGPRVPTRTAPPPSPSPTPASAPPHVPMPMRPDSRACLCCEPWQPLIGWGLGFKVTNNRPLLDPMSNEGLRSSSSNAPCFARGRVAEVCFAFAFTLVFDFAAVAP